MSIYDYDAKRIDGSVHSLSEYTGTVLLIVNTASRCGFTPQYEGLEKLYRQFGDQGFSVLGFPCNQFGRQEPGEEEDIQQFCSMNYDITFPLFAKIDVNGRNAHPLYRYLKRETGIWPFHAIKWNFTKFLIDRNGNVVNRFSPTTVPNKIEGHISSLL